MFFPKRVASAAVLCLVCNVSTAVSFHSDPWTVDVNGSFNMALVLSSCNKDAALVDILRCPSLPDSLGYYGLTNEFSPSYVSLGVSRQGTPLKVGGVLTVRLPVFNELVRRGDFTVSRAIPQSFIFWETPNSGRFEVGRDYPLLGRDISFFSGILPGDLQSFESFSSYRTHLPRSYASVSYHTPATDGFSAGISLGDGVELQSYIKDRSVETHLPNLSLHFSYENKLARFWINYFVQSLSYRHSHSSFAISAKELGIVLGPARLTGDGFSLVMNYQIGRAVGLLSDFWGPIGLELKGFPKISYLFGGVRYTMGLTRFFMGYSRTNLILRKRLSDGWVFSVSHQINPDFFLLGRLGVANWPGLVRNQQLRFVGVGFVLTF
ncbi:porin [Candidatus Ichthyocystis hellenicum]|uniref:porin n=1 Tax=Candidatus Ichthyocystis hellenicum TaxID=1561003 RepID=UPI000B88F8C9|nr:porin [Candidatus Ichthyocystis hellenicum]